MNYQLKNEQLLTEYKSYYDHLVNLFDDKTKKTLSLPIFMHVYPEYDAAAKKIMIIGQETKKWFGKLGDEKKTSAEEIVNNYKKFELAKTYYASPFWRFNRSFYNKYNPTEDKKDLKGMLWSNLSRVDQDGRGVNLEIRKKNKAGYELLVKEIEITQPETIVFLTSWKNDDTLKSMYPDLKLQKIEGVDSKYLVRLTSEKLPVNTFRTYHPRFLNGKVAKHTINQMIDLIAANS